MAYLRRIVFPGACYHLINRGNYRRRLFDEQGAANAFERTLAQAAMRFGWEIHAYVVMATHFHLAVRLGEPNLSAGMQWLQSTWVRRFNCFRRIVGRPFQGRYKAILVEPGRSFAQVCHYIHLNPVRAKIVSPEWAAVHQHGSLAKFPGKTRAAWLHPDTVLRAAGGLPDSSAGWKRYGIYLEFLATDNAARLELTRNKLSRGWCVASAEFKKRIGEQLRAQGSHCSAERFARLEPDGVQAERERNWSEALQKFAAAAGLKLGKLPAKKSAPEKVMLAAAMKQSTSASNAWLTARLHMGKPNSVSQFVLRGLRTRAGRTATESLLSKVEA